MAYRIDRDRIDELLTTYEARREDKRYHPEEMVRRNPEFRERFNQAARKVIVPVLQDVADVLRRRVDSASIFHRLTTAGITVKLDPWEDFDRTLLFFGDDGADVVRVTHEGVGFSYLRARLPLDELTTERVEEEAMHFLERVLHREPAGEAVGEDDVAAQAALENPPPPTPEPRPRRRTITPPA
jgi:hypothetical protein